MEHRVRPLHWLKREIEPLKSLCEDLRRDLLKIAEKESPTTTAQEAFHLATDAKLSDREVNDVVTATRWLAIIRRDHGEEAFKEAVKTLI